VTVTFVTRLGVHSIVVITTMKHVKLSKNSFSHFVVINIADINTGVIIYLFLNDVSLPFTCKTRMLRFPRQCRDIIQARWKTLISRYDKFSQENIYYTLSESATFKRYNKNIL